MKTRANKRLSSRHFYTSFLLLASSILGLIISMAGCGGSGSGYYHGKETLATLRGKIIMQDTVDYYPQMIRLSNRQNERVGDYIYLDADSFQQESLPVNYRMNLQVFGRAWELLAADTNLILKEGMNNLEIRVHTDSRYVIEGNGSRPPQIDKLPVYIPNSIIIAPRR